MTGADPADAFRPRLLGAVLAGGRSRRYGRDKARERVGGLTMVERAVRTLGAVSERVVLVSADRDLAEALGLDVLPDLVPGQGPLGGLATALDAAAAGRLDGVAVLACDLPLVSVAVFRDLVAHWDGRNALLPVSRGPLGVEPLCAVYPVELLDRATADAATPDRSMGSFVARIPALTVLDAGGPDEGWRFLNVNRPEDLDRAEALLAERGAGP